MICFSSYDLYIVFLLCFQVMFFPYCFSGKLKSTKQEAAVTPEHNLTGSGENLAWRKPVRAVRCQGRSCLGTTSAPWLGHSSQQLGSAANKAVPAVSRSVKIKIQCCDYSHYIHYPGSDQLHTGIEKNDANYFLHMAVLG